MLSASAADAPCAHELVLAHGAPLLRICRVALDYACAPIDLRLSRVNTDAAKYQVDV